MLRQTLVEARRNGSAPDRADRQQRGVELGERRRLSGQSIEQVAHLAGLSAAHVSRIERGLNVPSAAALAKIATALTSVPPTDANPISHGQVAD